ncbi:hypothetical protein LO772_25860 [Yinghuangia sp. ASG 101]|uniref:hypothetical protein n=1 Tax=Yinghuangia sp. ASG 101 TaxID=2896848 RepID=UPI001E2AB518|nr:hypothetical protein [Yinghuangia sp. ASG 101]UGQ10269.1 hypothetical protein LO772_25860 [Yinghuangia sp. ASG 101]
MSTLARGVSPLSIFRSRPPLRTRVAAASLAAAAVLSGCSVGGDKKAAPLPTSVCGGLPTDQVTDLLPQGTLTVREDQRPEPRYPALHCEVSSGDTSFVASVQPLNMSGSDLVQLAGATTSAAAPLLARDSSLNGMVGPDDAWVTRECKLSIGGELKPVGMLVRARVLDGAPSDHREELADLVARLATKVNASAKCGLPAPSDPEPVLPAPARLPVTDANVCWYVDPNLLGPAAQGDQRARWSSSVTPNYAFGPAVNPGGYVQTCDLFYDNRPVLSFTAVGGYLAPTTEVPGERGRLTQRVTSPAPDDEAAAQADAAVGAVVAAVNGRRADDPATPDTDESCLTAYRMSRGQAAPEEVLGVPVEPLFRAFVAGAQAPVGDREINCPVAPDASWQFG